MVILGIDLSSQPSNTAGCLLIEQNGRIMAESPHLGCNDAQLDSLIVRANAVGIDAPFGWPQKFAEAVAGWISPFWNNALRDQMRFRLTDLEVNRLTKLTPLSVSTDKIALPGMRTMALLHRHKILNKSGEGHFFEVYPAATLLQWGLPSRGYKGASPERVKIRQRMLQDLRRLHPCLFVPDEYAMIDHAFDSLVAALTAREAANGRTIRPGRDQIAAARREGWIHLPARHSSAQEPFTRTVSG